MVGSTKSNVEAGVQGGWSLRLYSILETFSASMFSMLSGMIPRGWSRWRRVFRALAPFARPHRRWFLKGSLAAFMVVGFRLALPWPLRVLIGPWLSGQTVQSNSVPSWIPVGVDPTIAMGGIFLLLLLGLGYADFVERINFTRFAIRLVRDLRAEALRAVLRNDPLSQSTRTGDLVARLIGDTARIKAGLQGFLVHVATNGLMFVGVTAVLIWMDTTLGFIFAGAGLLAGAVTAFGASRIFGKALKHRKKEGKLADSIHQVSVKDPREGRFARVNRSSGAHEASVTRIQGITTWCVHGILGIAVMASLWVGGHAVSDGRLSGGDLFVFLAYVLILRAPMVQLARQGGRTGKIIASGDRLAQLLNVPQEAGGTNPLLAPLRDCLRLLGMKVSSGRRRRLGPINLDFHAGQCIAIVGEPGSGKSTLLELIAGNLKPGQGQVLWDGVEQGTIPAQAWSQQIEYLPQDPTWGRRTVREFLDLPSGAAPDKALKIMCACAAQSIIKRLPRGLDSRVGSADLSFGERKALGVARTILGDASLWLLDDPVGALNKRKAIKSVHAILDTADHRTVLVAFNRPFAIDRFDRVIELRRGRIVFDGPPAEWLMGASNRTRGDSNQV